MKNVDAVVIPAISLAEAVSSKVFSVLPTMTTSALETLPVSATRINAERNYNIIYYIKKRGFPAKNGAYTRGARGGHFSEK